MEALAMGKYGIYVWSCFGITFLMVLAMDVMSRMRHKRIYREIEVRIKALEDRE